MAALCLIVALPALKGNAANIPFAFYAIVSITVIGLYIAYAIPIYLRWRMGDGFVPGPWTLGKQVPLDVPGRRRRGDRHLHLHVGAVRPVRDPGQDGLRARQRRRQLRAGAGGRGDPVRGHLVAGLGQELVHRAGDPERECQSTPSWPATERERWPGTRVPRARHRPRVLHDARRGGADAAGTARGARGRRAPDRRGGRRRRRVRRRSTWRRRGARPASASSASPTSRRRACASGCSAPAGRRPRWPRAAPRRRAQAARPG